MKDRPHGIRSIRAVGGDQSRLRKHAERAVQIAYAAYMVCPHCKTTARTASRKCRAWSANRRCFRRRISLGLTRPEMAPKPTEVRKLRLPQPGSRGLGCGQPPEHGRTELERRHRRDYNAGVRDLRPLAAYDLLKSHRRTHVSMRFDGLSWWASGR